MSYTPARDLVARRLSAGAGNGPRRKVGLEIFGTGPYPHSMEEFIGQARAKNQLLTAMRHARESGTQMDHVLLASGLPGVGKTTLARLVAYEMGVGIVEVGGSVGDQEAKAALRSLMEGDVLFLDEVHRLVNRGKARAEWLLQLLQDGELVLPTGSIKAGPFTCIAATTDAQKLPETILDRFVLRPVLDPYTEDEAVQVALGAALRIGFSHDQDSAVALPDWSDEWLHHVARCCNNNPRRMTQLLTNLRNIVSTGSGRLTKEGWDLTVAREWAGLTEDGLDTLAQQYLTGLFAYGGRAGIATIKALLDEDQLRHTEKLVIQKGMVAVTPRGRELTELGMERAEQLATEAIANA